MTENLNLQRALLHRLSSTPTVELVGNVKVQSIAQESENGGWPLVHLSDGRTIRARLLVRRSLLNICLSPLTLYSGRCRWLQFACTFLCWDQVLRLGVQYPRSRRNTLPFPSGRLGTTKHNSLSTFPPHRSHRVPSTLRNGFLNGLVN